jgi:hypothetical protein
MMLARFWFPPLQVFKNAPDCVSVTELVEPFLGSLTVKGRAWRVKRERERVSFGSMIGLDVGSNLLSFNDDGQEGVHQNEIANDEVGPEEEGSNFVGNQVHRVLRIPKLAE